jgi:ABC-type multidrug transport system fused ATPase/permease subunit
LASFFAIVLANGIQMVKTWAVARYALMRAHSISHRLMVAYLRQPYEFFLNRHSGEMGTRLLAEAGSAVQQFLRPAADVIAAGLTVLALVGFLIWVEPVIAIVALTLLGGSYGAVYAFSRRILQRLGRERVQVNSARFRIANEALGGIKDLKLLGQEAAYAARFERPSRRMARVQVSVQLISQLPRFALQALAFGGIILLCLALLDPVRLASGAGAAVADILPTLGVFALAGQRLMPELSTLYRALATLQSGSAAVDIVYEDLVQKAGGGSLPRDLTEGLGLRERLEISGVSYRYPNADQPGLRDISLSILAGEKIGIVGSSGAGKTTLADLVLGLLEPASGELRVDGKAVTAANVRAWQQSVGYVPQDIFLIDASVSENIALGLPPTAIHQARVEEAARIAQLHEFIRSDLPQGYATHVGERGVRLSGGQRQRIGIARALYHDADLIVFDEATSALDNLTEREVMAAIDALPGDKTVLMIAHRLSTVKRCDRIVVLDHGLLVGFDTWEALMQGNEAFRRIARLGEAA